MHRNPQKYLEIDIDDEYETLLMNCTLTARVPGEGKFIMTEKNREITLTNLRTSEKHILLKEEVEDIIDEINNSNLFTVAAWQEIFGEEFPRIAPAQDKENKPKSEEKEAEITENKASEEPETVADKENKPIVEKIDWPKAEDILLPEAEPTEEASKAAADEEASKYVEASQKMTEELNKDNSKSLEEMVQAQAEDTPKEETTAMELFWYARDNMDRLEVFLNAGSDAEAKRIIDTITEDLQEIRNRL
jgi:hypothetical protein